MRIRFEQRTSRRVILAGVATMIVAATATAHLAQAPAGAAGTVKGFVRVNGNAVVVGHAYAVSAPDSFDPSEEVKLVLVTASPIAADALAKASNRNDVFGLVAAGAVVEVRKNGHNVFLRHSALGGKQLQTGGGFPTFKTTADRVSGDVHTFMSGDEDSFGFKVRFELAFDAPIVKRLPLAKPTTSTAPVSAAKAPPGPLPKTRDEAKKWLAAQGYGVGEESLLIYFTLGSKGLSADVVRAFLTLGTSVNRKSEFSGDTALNALTIACPGQAAGAEVAKILLDAGADVNIQESESRKATPIMGAVFCPDVFPLILAKKPNLNVVDASGLTVMHYALRYGKPNMPQMLKDAGFDMARWRASLVDEFGASTVDAIGKPATTASRATPSPSPAPAVRASGTQPAATTATGFIRVNGDTLPLTSAFAVTAPDSFASSREVILIVVTPTPVSNDVLSKMTSRDLVFTLVPAGAIVEMGRGNHNVFLKHKALAGKQLQTGGDADFKVGTDRVSGYANTFTSGDEESFGFQVRYETAFDVPIVKRLFVGTPQLSAPRATTAAAPTTPSSSVPRPAAMDWKALGPYPPRSKAEAAKLLSRPGTSTTVDEQFWDAVTSREPQRLAVALQAGANVKQTRQGTGYSPLVLLAERCDLNRDAEAQTSIAEQLIAAGADLAGLDANKANALTVGAGNCPLGVITAMIKAGVGLQAASALRTTPLSVAIMAGRVDVVDALLDAGIDPKKEPQNPGKLASGNKAIEAALKKKRK